MLRSLIQINLISFLLFQINCSALKRNNDSSPCCIITSVESQAIPEIDIIEEVDTIDDDEVMELTANAVEQGSKAEAEEEDMIAGLLDLSDSELELDQDEVPPNTCFQ